MNFTNRLLMLMALLMGLGGRRSHDRED